MDKQAAEVSLPPTDRGSAEGLMLKEDAVREIISRLQRGERVKAVARELGVDRKNEENVPGVFSNHCVLGVSVVNFSSSSVAAKPRWGLVVK